MDICSFCSPILLTMLFKASSKDVWFSTSDSHVWPGPDGPPLLSHVWPDGPPQFSFLLI